MLSDLSCIFEVSVFAYVFLQVLFWLKFLALSRLGNVFFIKVFNFFAGYGLRDLGFF